MNTLDFSKYAGITCDSRKVEPGFIFVAIPGARYDGMAFVSQALERGAKMIVAEKEIPVPLGVEFKQVPSARAALADFACAYYDHPTRNLKLIGITGTNGKTTTAYLIRSILEKAGYKVGLLGTIDSALTTPEASELQSVFAAMLKDGFTHCVMEVSSHALAQSRVRGCHFSVAIFTNLTHDHLDYHKTMERYLEEKCKLFSMLPPDGIAIINVDDPASFSLISCVRGEVVPYGITQARHELRSTKHNEYDAIVSDIQMRDDIMQLNINTFEMRTSLLGMHNVYNILAAFQCGLVFHIPPWLIKEGIEALKGVPGRGENVNCGQSFKVIVDFAHSPDALQKLMETYRPLTNGKIILVFGCPGERDREKRPIMGEIASRLADYSIITTDDPHGENPQAIVDEISKAFTIHDSRFTIQIDRRKAIVQALSMAKSGDTVLLAGRGHEKYQDFAGKKVALDDCEVVRALLCDSANR